jgi:hypothetical protein
MRQLPIITKPYCEMVDGDMVQLYQLILTLLPKGKKSACYSSNIVVEVPMIKKASKVLNGLRR